LAGNSDFSFGNDGADDYRFWSSKRLEVKKWKQNHL
jgi:hypothetical protein